MAGSEFTGETSEGSRKKANQKHSTLGLEAVEAEEIVEKEMMDNAGKKRKGGAWDEIQSTVPAQKKGASHWFCYRRGRHQHRNT